ncbi:hypothetical protein GALMADRAFT_76825 [Galerina marginata CBS 339.88]|uniref:Uncharacterized protein n=1 Tax=Galerina marginata (strain CBS 339.88) TaxID=685588 RepID=A0A067SGC3_GALM3|nr:hypothetical protein GALMADRAFT_76825 [Galerina marginata CBS 339.88]
MPDPGYSIYQQEMIQKKHGFPVWFGDPYGKDEIQIGDIGYMDEGAFQVITRFPMPVTVETPIPKDFPVPIFSESLKQREIRTESGGTVPMLPAGVAGHISLSTSRSACAILNLEDKVAWYTRCSLVKKVDMERWFRNNARQLLADAVNEHKIPEGFPVGRLILVTGFYKTGNWEAVALSTSSSTGEFNFTLEAMGAMGGTSYNWNSLQHLSPDYSIGHRHPSYSPVPQNESLHASTPLPTIESDDMQFHEAQAQIHRPRSSNMSEGQLQSFSRCCHDHRVKNQCIFLRGFRYRERVLLKDKIEVLVTLEDWKPSLLQRMQRIFAPTPHPTDTATSKSPAVPKKPLGNESTTSQPGLSVYLEPIERLPDSDPCVRSHRV